MEPWSAETESVALASAQTSETETKQFFQRSNWRKTEKTKYKTEIKYRSWLRSWRRLRRGRGLETTNNERDCEVPFFFSRFRFCTWGVGGAGVGGPPITHAPVGSQTWFFFALRMKFDMVVVYCAERTTTKKSKHVNYSNSANKQQQHKRVYPAVSPRVKQTSSTSSFSVSGWSGWHLSGRTQRWRHTEHQTTNAKAKLSLFFFCFFFFDKCCCTWSAQRALPLISPGVDDCAILFRSKPLNFVVRFRFTYETERQIARKCTATVRCANLYIKQNEWEISKFLNYVFFFCSPERYRLDIAYKENPTNPVISSLNNYQQMSLHILNHENKKQEPWSRDDSWSARRYTDANRRPTHNL